MMSMFPFYRTTLSSTLFLTNIAHLYNKNDSYYLYSFIGLFVTSILYHQSRNYSWFHRVIGYCDKLCVMNIVCYGGSMLFTRPVYDIYTGMVILTFTGVNWLYFYGYLTNKYIFDENVDIGNNYHMLLHTLTSIGHQLIISTIM